MRFGVCCSLEDADLARRLGADFVEVAAVGFGQLPADEFDADAWRDHGIEATNVFFPDDYRLVGPGATSFTDYAKATIERAALIGVRVMVLGSGAQRRAPFEVAPSRGTVRLVEIARQLQDLADPYDIQIAPESLSRSETNVGNDLAFLTRALHLAHVGFTADSFHILREWDADMRERDAERLVPTPFFLGDQMPFNPAHVHIADLYRRAPDPSDPMVRAFVRHLKSKGYDGRLSLECSRGPISDFLPKALDDLRLLVEEA